MDKLIHQFEFGLFFGKYYYLLIFLLKKFAWKPILDAVNDRRRNQNALLSAENARKKCKTFKLTINVFYKKLERDNMLKT
jgi:F-type H+-transporting ATPase subunit b